MNIVKELHDSVRNTFHIVESLKPYCDDCTKRKVVKTYMYARGIWNIFAVDVVAS